MFWPDVLQLKQFYSSKLGQIACRIVRKHIRELWPEVREEVILGIGYAPPYLLPFAEEAGSVFALMPAQQGVIHWPQGKPNLTFTADEGELPFPDHSIHKILLVHSIEHSEHAQLMLEEIWRVLMPGGKLVIIAPNRGGLWSRLEHTPFGHGRPFTRTQLALLLERAKFTLGASETMLFTPPSASRWVLRLSPFLEKTGRRLAQWFGGLLLCEAEKQVYAIHPITKPARARKTVLVPATRPALNRK